MQKENNNNMGLTCKKSTGKMKSIMRKLDNEILKEKQIKKKSKRKEEKGE